METNTSNSVTKKRFKLQKRHKKLFIISIALLVLVGLMLGSYLLGYKNAVSKKEATKENQPQQSSTDYAELIKQIDAVASSSGTVSSVDINSLKIVNSLGEVESFKITDNTKVTKKTQTLTLADIKVNQKITVFSEGNNQELQATRIVIKSE